MIIESSDAKRSTSGLVEGSQGERGGRGEGSDWSEWRKSSEDFQRLSVLRMIAAYLDELASDKAPASFVCLCVCGYVKSARHSVAEELAFYLYEVPCCGVID